MTATERLSKLAGRLDTELREHILPYWFHTIDPRGGLAGNVVDDGTPDFSAPKGVVMHARHLWASSTAWMHRHNALDLRTAEVAFRFLSKDLYDHSHKGFWWTVTSKGRPEFQNKVIYGQGFAIYGLAQYHRATGDKRALELAMETFELLERVGRDRIHGGYFEAVDRTWKAPLIQALSAVDIPCAKSMNTNLHVLEAYSALYLATKSPQVLEALGSLLTVFEKHILVTPEHLGMYFDADWTNLTTHVSYGHDIEASWLMTEAAHVLGTPDRARNYLPIALKTLKILGENGGSLPNELHHGHLDSDRIWWVQAEALVGLVNAWELTKDAVWIEAAEALWNWIETRQADRRGGEWFWLVRADGTPDRSRPKGGLWKTSYHNGRACMEVIERARRTK